MQVMKKSSLKNLKENIRLFIVSTTRWIKDQSRLTGRRSAPVFRGTLISLSGPERAQVRGEMSILWPFEVEQQWLPNRTP